MLEGAEIFFRCNPGFVPAERMTAVCRADGRWNPDPADLVCTCKIIKASVQKLIWVGGGGVERVARHTFFPPSKTIICVFSTVS